jgi:hypothetical protein
LVGLLGAIAAAVTVPVWAGAVGTPERATVPYASREGGDSELFIRHGRTRRRST